jgi:hypothetical protein
VAYADDVVMWMWVAALLGTLVAFAIAWRALARAETALADLGRELSGLDAVGAARADLEDATRAVAGERIRLRTRAAGG